MDVSDDPYGVLGLDRSATMEEVQSAYRERSLRYHPDRGGDAWAFKQVQAAYEAIVTERDQAQKVGDPSNAPASDQPPTSTSRKDWFNELPVWQQVTAIIAVSPLTFVYFFGFVNLLWLLFSLAILVAAVGIGLSRSAHTTDERHAAWIMAGVSAVAAVALWFGISQLSFNDGPAAQAAIQTHARAPSAPVNETPEGVEKDSTGWSVPGRAKGVLRGIKFVHERFGIVGLFAALIIGIAVYGWFDSRRSRENAKASGRTIS